MADKYQGKYRIPSARLINYDYGSAGMYFITICTKNRCHYFGKIQFGKMELSEIGLIAQLEWLKTPEIRTDMNIELGEFVVMPDHFHAVLIIGDNRYNRRDCDGHGDGDDGVDGDGDGDGDGGVDGDGDGDGDGGGDGDSDGDGDGDDGVDGDGDGDGDGRDAMHCVSTATVNHTVINPITTTIEKTIPIGNGFQPQSKNLASIIRGFKSAVTTYARKNDIRFNWQRRYHDHVIRNALSYRRIQRYIRNNPKNWIN